MTKRVLSVDIETFSSVNIGKSGLYAYSSSPDFKILLLSFCLEVTNVAEVIDLTIDPKLPWDILGMLNSPNIIKRAYNAAFEITCLNAFGIHTPPEQWQDTMLHGTYLGYPAGLAKIGEALGLPEDQKKASIGKALIRYFCMPCKPTKHNGGRTVNLPKHDREKWELFKEYNRQDVVTEMAISKKLSAFPVPDAVQQQWLTDYKINSRGVMVDKTLISSALDINAAHRNGLVQRAQKLTGLANPNSREQLLNWINSNSDANMPDLTKATVAATNTTNTKVNELLRIRKQLAKSSVSKYEAMARAMGPDSRIRGLLQFYGARTGRWAGRLVQVQNLPRTYINLALARHLVLQDNAEAVRLVFGDVSDTLSQLIRTAFIAPKDKLLCVADFSAIEARVLAWLAGEKWKLNIFETSGKIYEATAARMFNVPMSKITKGNPEYELRQKGKIAELALGYQGGPNALVAMGALEKGIKEDDLPAMVKMWRNANSGICRFWNEVQEAAEKVILAGPGFPYGVRSGDLIFRLEEENDLRFLTIELPSHRKLFYPDAHIGTNKFGKTAIIFKSLVGNSWCEESTYGGKLVENITQAVARDCLAEALERIEADPRFSPLMHIHDEVVMEIALPPKDTDLLKYKQDMLHTAIKLMCKPMPWAPGLPLNADGFTGKYYRKE